MSREREEKQKLEDQLMQLQNRVLQSTAVAEKVQDSELKKMQEYRDLRK